MRRLLLAGLVAAAVASSAPVAYAAADSTYQGGCGFSSFRVDGDPATIGEVDVKAVVYSPTPGANPVSATITCYVTVDGVVQPGALVASGTVVVAGAGPLSYSADPWYADVRFCQRVDYTGPGDTTPTEDVCFEGHDRHVPPPIVWELLPWWMLCLASAVLAPGAGPVYTDSEGDVYVNGEPVWDCPPYDIDWGSR